MDTLFIQFYSRVENTNPRFKGHSIYEVCNGFSDTWDYCKTKGDFLWVNHGKQPRTHGHLITENFKTELPITKGTVYVSAYYFSQMCQIMEWAKQYPNVTFIAGGPSSNPRTFFADYRLFPNNMVLMNKTVEEYFGIPNFSYPWKLELPDEDHKMTLMYTYNIRSSCYWGKCTFCNFSQGSRIRKNLKFEFLDVKYDGFQRVALYNPSTTGNELKKIYADLGYKKNIRYDIFIRGNKTEREALKEILKTKKTDFPQVKFMLGVDFPSDRMLKVMNKNATVEGILETIDIISNFPPDVTQLQFPFIAGWDNLTQQDVDDMEIFLTKLPYDKMNISFGLTMISARPYTYVFDNYKKKKELHWGPFYYGYEPLISDNQIELSKQVANLLYNTGKTVFDYYKIRDM